METFEILDCPQNWVAMIKWIWNYGHERQILKVQNGSMLPILDSAMYIAVASNSDDAGSPLLR